MNNDAIITIALQRYTFLVTNAIKQGRFRLKSPPILM